MFIWITQYITQVYLYWTWFYTSIKQSYKSSTTSGSRTVYTSGAGATSGLGTAYTSGTCATSGLGTACTSGTGATSGLGTAYTSGTGATSGLGTAYTSGTPEFTSGFIHTVLGSCFSCCHI